jgi:hypothetical protein
MLKSLSDWLSHGILSYLEKPTGRYAPFFTPGLDIIAASLQPCDVLLIEGNSRLSAIIKHLTQSTWSHAALYVGDHFGAPPRGEEARVLIEAEAAPGVIASPLSKYAKFNIRVCRPVGLTDAERRKVIAYAAQRLGMQYDSQQVIDVARYLLPYPPVPVSLRRRLLAVGSGDPTRAICSTLIGEAFASIRYPILPENAIINGKSYAIAPYVKAESEHIRRRGLFTPRDFDVSPYFEIVKPQFAQDFDYRALKWRPDHVHMAGCDCGETRPQVPVAAMNAATARRAPRGVQGPAATHP